MEDDLLTVASDMQQRYSEQLATFRKGENTVLFYDGFGLDTRGLALGFINGLVKAVYHVYYVVPETAKGQQPEIHRIAQGKVEWMYFATKSGYLNRTKELIGMVLQARPKAMFFYTTPDDVEGCVLFGVFAGLLDRYQVDLTDHAFWLGTKVNDYFFGSRGISMSNQLYKRHIPREKLLRFDVNLLIPQADDHSGLPFDPLKECYVFSGGALYKTLGDNEKLFYRTIEHIMQRHPDIKFLYAGEGDTSEMMQLVEEHPKRVFYIHERKDFFYLMQHSLLYLNTYPMFGGMMMRYAAYAGRLPITLVHEHDAEGLLLHQKEAHIEYDSYEEMLKDIDKLLENADYRHEREKLLKGQILTEKEFVAFLCAALEEHRTGYDYDDYEERDTSKFLAEYYRRFDWPQEKAKLLHRLRLPDL